MAVRAVVLSDTHGIVRPLVREYLKSCDCVIHAGDFDDEETLDDIGGYAPLYAVRGNNDWVLSRRLQPSLRFQLGEMRFFMVHNRVTVPHGLTGADAVIFGHTHRYFSETRGGVLWLNPGSCGRSRFGSELSFAVMTIEGRSAEIEKIVIPID